MHLVVFENDCLIMGVIVKSIVMNSRKEFLDMQENNKSCHVLFVCHGSILKNPGKASKINGFTADRCFCYTTTTPFLKEL